MTVICYINVCEENEKQIENNGPMIHLNNADGIEK